MRGIEPVGIGIFGRNEDVSGAADAGEIGFAPGVLFGNRHLREQDGFFGVASQWTLA
jgi:hypothetical protein